MSTDALAAAFASTRSVMVAVSPEQYERPTPCASWDVRALMNHIIAGSHYFAVTARNGEPPAAVEPPDFTEEDPLTAYDAGIRASLAAFAAPEALTRTITLPFGSMPGSAFLRIACVDTFAHGWDLAKATGQNTDLAPDLARDLLAGARESLPDALRGPEGSPFGPAVEVPEDASPADQLAGFLGRQP
jgi:uncharacterized protein (TIGR03086 family)